MTKTTTDLAAAVPADLAEAGKVADDLRDFTEDDAYAEPWAFGETCKAGADTITALLAQNAALRAERDDAIAKRAAFELGAKIAAEAERVAKWERDRAEAAEAVAEKLRGALDTFPPDWRDRAHSFKGAFKLQQAWADGFNAARAALTTEAGE